MPLPKGAEDFLDIAVKCLKNKGYIHFYNWGKLSQTYLRMQKKLYKKSLAKMGVKYKIINKRKVLPYAPRKWKVCLRYLCKKG